MPARKKVQYNEREVEVEDLFDDFDEPVPGQIVKPIVIDTPQSKGKEEVEDEEEKFRNVGGLLSQPRAKRSKAAESLRVEPTIKRRGGRTKVKYAFQPDQKKRGLFLRNGTNGFLKKLCTMWKVTGVPLLFQTLTPKGELVSFQTPGATHLFKEAIENSVTNKKQVVHHLTPEKTEKFFLNQTKNPWKWKKNDPMCPPDKKISNGITGDHINGFYANGTKLVDEISVSRNLLGLNPNYSTIAQYDDDVDDDI